MAMNKALGTALQTGVTASGITGLHEQSGGRNAGGELKFYYDKDYNMIAIYTADKHKEYSFEALLETAVVDKEKGDPITINNTLCVVTLWDVTERNDDVKRVSIGARTVPDISSGSSSTQSTQSTQSTPSTQSTQSQT